MKNITIKNYKGNEYAGEWNEKTYTSKIDSDNLVRIYVGGKEINVRKEDLKAVGKDMVKDEREKRIRDAKIKFAEFTDENDVSAKFDIFKFMLDTLAGDWFLQEYEEYLSNNKEDADHMIQKMERLSEDMKKRIN